MDGGILAAGVLCMVSVAAFCVAVVVLAATDNPESSDSGDPPDIDEMLANEEGEEAHVGSDESHHLEAWTIDGDKIEFESSAPFVLDQDAADEEIKFQYDSGSGTESVTLYKRNLFGYRTWKE